MHPLQFAQPKGKSTKAALHYIVARIIKALIIKDLYRLRGRYLRSIKESLLVHGVV